MAFSSSFDIKIDSASSSYYEYKTSEKSDNPCHLLLKFPVSYIRFSIDFSLTSYSLFLF